ARAEVEREPVEELEQLVVALPIAWVAAELGFLLRHERVDLVLHLRGASETEVGVEPVALAVDAGSVHRDEQPGIRVLLRDRRDPGAVEREVRADVDLEEVDRLPRVVEPRRLLPHRPAVVVALGGDDERRRERCRPGTGEGRGEVGVVGLHDDLPRVAEVADDHARAPLSSSTCSTTSSTETTSPYFVSMS